MLPGLGDAYYNNTCIMPGSTAPPPPPGPAPPGPAPPHGSSSLGFVPCETTEMTMHDNSYYLDAYESASIACSGKDVPLKEMFATDGLEKDSAAYPKPTDEELVAWAKERLW